MTTRYSPLPSIRIDPRTERELVSAASEEVYRSSNGTLNDFSSGSPIVALLEGQAFAQAEFLYWASKLPEAILIDWIGPFLGAQRKLGTTSLVNLRFDINPRDTPFVIASGFLVSTDPNLTNGLTIEFFTNETLTIPPGVSFGEITATSVTTGKSTNVPANSIVRFTEQLSGLNSVTNVEPSTGGEDFETVDQVKERFFSLIRRRNPVSAEDWRGLMEDILGVGTQTSVLPRRSSTGRFIEETCGHFSLFSLNADGTELTTAQINSAQEILNLKTPVSLDVHLYSKQLFDVDCQLRISYNPGLPYSQNLEQLSLQLRNLTREILLPGNEFPIEYSPSVTDLESALNSTFPAQFNSTNRYVDPDILSFITFVSPDLLTRSSFRNINVSPIILGFRVNRFDLVIRDNIFYEALQSFNPVPNNEEFYTNTNKLVLRRKENLNEGFYNRSRIIEDDGNLYVVLKDFSYRGESLSQLITEKKISAAKTPISLIVGNSVNSIIDNSYNPDILVRDSNYFYVANENFIVESPTSDFSTAQNLGLISGNSINPVSLIIGNTYLRNQYINFENNTYRVLQDFTFISSDTVQSLLNELKIQIVKVINFENQSQSFFEDVPFRYTTRFKLGEYIRFIETTGDILFFIALRDFTPFTTDISILEQKNLILQVSEQEVQNNFRDLFRFIPGDTAIFRQSSSRLRAFTASNYITPIMELDVYLENDIFFESSFSETKKFFDKDYNLEDIIQDDESFHRTILPFTPELGNGREFDLAGNTIKIVNKKECNDNISSPLNSSLSANNLGFFDVTLISQNSTGIINRFVWEQNDSVSDNNIDYGEGTLAL